MAVVTIMQLGPIARKISVFIFEPSQAEREQKAASPTHVRTNPVSLRLLPLQSCLTTREWE